MIEFGGMETDGKQEWHVQVWRCRIPTVLAYYYCTGIAITARADSTYAVRPKSPLRSRQGQ